MDRTFWTAPKYFFQLFTIHGTVGKKSMPFIYGFMGDKREESYRAVFRKLRERVFQLLPDFDVEARWTHMKRIRPKRRRIYDNNDIRLNEYTTELNIGGRSRMEFLRAASYLVAQFGNAPDVVA